MYLGTVFGMLLSGMIAASVDWEWVFYIFGKYACQFTSLFICSTIYRYMFVCKTNTENVNCAHRHHSSFLTHDRIFLRKFFEAETVATR